MSTSISRRDWLRSSTLLTAGLFAAPSVSPLLAGPTSPIIPASIYERNLNFPADMRALRARLLANENPFGPSELVKNGLKASMNLGNRYGWDEIDELRGMIASEEGVSKDHIMLGPGSSYLLEMAAIAHCRKKGNIVAADPTFMSLIRSAMAVGAKWRLVPLADDYSHDLSAMASKVNGKTRLVYICNPNNPTGTLTPTQDLRNFCTDISAKVPVFVDEAYLDYLGQDSHSQSMVSQIQAGQDVIVARTFSKIRGMAGLRVGYLVGLPHRLKRIRDLVNPHMTLSVASVKAAMMSMEDTEFIEYTRTWTAEARAHTFSSLQNLGIKAIPSVTSFMMFPLQVNGDDFIHDMRDQGIGIRVFQMNEQPWCRVSMGTMQEMDMFIVATRVVLQG